MRSPDSQAGFTIIEVLVAAIIVAIMSAGIATALISAEGASGDQRTRAEADALAAQDQERLRGLSDEQLSQLGGAGQTHTPSVSGFDGMSFAVNSTAAAVTQQGASSCGSGGASDFRITSTVTWTELSGTDINHVTVDSLIARPTTGDLLTVVDDQAGNPLPGVTVATTSGPSSESGTTDSNGCSLFAGVSPGAYTVQFSDPGYVDPTGSQTPSFNTTVTATGTPPINTESLGLAGTIAATFKTAGGLAGEATALSYASTGNATAKSTTPGLATSSIISPPLYPFDTSASPPANYQNNYTVWGGACPQQVPASPNATTESVSPGFEQSVAVKEPGLLLSKVTYNGAAVTPVGLKLSFASLSGTSCSDTWSAAVASPQSPSTPPSTGWLADPGQPYADGTTGKLAVCASYVTPAGATVSGTAVTTNANFTAATPVAPIVLNQVGSCS